MQAFGQRSRATMVHGLVHGVTIFDIVIESIEQSGKATIVYATSDSAAYSAWASWQRIDGMIGESGAHLSLGHAEVTYELNGPDLLLGNFAHKSGQVTLGL